MPIPTYCQYPKYHKKVGKFNKTKFLSFKNESATNQNWFSHTAAQPQCWTLSHENSTVYMLDITFFFYISLDFGPLAKFLHLPQLPHPNPSSSQLSFRGRSKRTSTFEKFFSVTNSQVLWVIGEKRSFKSTIEQPQTHMKSIGCKATSNHFSNLN